ncbi:cytosolic carboxypeptidase [Skeletonema marinoi]|uniref:Cytosolic carboxypeptidase n=1 Tax=Skeletonema marinoi TaxID=267567 RepID=A0AAD8Y8N6_9STRA|nr:cytosolic carboxypeptidase [Skeletonema marinoi]
MSKLMFTAALLLVSSSTRGRGGTAAFQLYRRSSSTASAFVNARTTHHQRLSPGIIPKSTASSTSSPLSASLRDLLEGGSTRSSSSMTKAADEAKSPPAQAAAAAVENVVETTLPIKETPTQPVKKSTSNSIISISDSYDSGNGEFVSFNIADGEEDYTDVIVHVNIKADPFTDLEQKSHFQSFSFRSSVNFNSPAIRGIFSDKKSIKVKYVVDNANEASYADAWNGASIFVTEKSTPYDADSWHRTSDTNYEKGVLSWTHVHDLDGESSSAYFAYFPPYSYERHLGLIAQCAESEGARVFSLGQTVSGREIDCVKVGTGPRKCWIIHRQHPGESMASFYAEGLLNRLLALDDKWDNVSEKARELFTFYIVPNINPDGSANGYLRTNAAGSNLNREWCPSPSPPSADGSSASEISYYLLNTWMNRGSQGMSVWGKRLEALHGAFLASYERANQDMQAKVSYDPDKPNEGMKNICSNQIADRFDCFSATLEMPFKDVGDVLLVGSRESGAARRISSRCTLLCAALFT